MIEQIKQLLNETSDGELSEREFYCAVLELFSVYPAPSAEPVVFQAREIGEGDWFNVGLDEIERINAYKASAQFDYRWLYAAPQPDSWRVEEMEAEIDKLGDSVIQLRASRDSLLVERNSLARSVAELEAECERLAFDLGEQCRRNTELIAERDEALAEVERLTKQVQFLRSERPMAKEVDRLRNLLKRSLDIFSPEWEDANGNSLVHLCEEIDAALAAKGE